MDIWTRKNIQNYTSDPDEESDKKYSIEMQKIRNEIRKLDKQTKSQELSYMQQSVARLSI